MPSRSRLRREHAIKSCPKKVRYNTLRKAASAARILREKARDSSERNLVPYCCPNGRDHYHIGRNIVMRRCIDLLYERFKKGLPLDVEDLTFMGLL